MYLVFTCMPGERDTIGISDLCCCTYVTYLERQRTPLCVDSATGQFAAVVYITLFLPPTNEVKFRT